MKKFFALVLVSFLIISNFTACELKDDLMDTDGKDSTFKETEVEQNKADTDTKTNSVLETETKESEGDLGIKTESVSDIDEISILYTVEEYILTILTCNM